MSALRLVCWTQGKNSVFLPKFGSWEIKYTNGYWPNHRSKQTSDHSAQLWLKPDSQLWLPNLTTTPAATGQTWSGLDQQLLNCFLHFQLWPNQTKPNKVSKPVTWDNPLPGSPLPASLSESHWTVPWNSPGPNTGVGSLSLLQGIFPTQGSNPGLPHCRQIRYQLSHKAASLEQPQTRSSLSPPSLFSL